MNGDEKRIVIIFHNTAEKARIKYLEEINDYKSKLISTVSHELRTPLNSSINMTEMALMNDTVPTQIKETLLKPSFFS